MFDTHQKEIAAYAKQDCECMARVITFVYCTVQQQLNIVPGIMGDIDQEQNASNHLWGWKRTAYEWLQEHKAEVYTTAMAIYDGHANPAIAEFELLKYFASLPGLGLIKGGFVIQLCFGLSGCIDRHNIKRFDLNENAFAAGKFKRAKLAKTRNRIARQYCELVAKCGGTRALWNDWCEYVADKYSTTYPDAWYVSAIHCEAILDWQEPENIAA